MTEPVRAGPLKRSSDYEDGRPGSRLEAAAAEHFAFSQASTQTTTIWRMPVSVSMRMAKRELMLGPGMEKLGLTVPEAAAPSSLGQTSIYKEIREGRLRIRKYGTRTIITRADLARKRGGSATRR